MNAINKHTTVGKVCAYNAPNDTLHEKPFVPFIETNSYR